MTATDKDGHGEQPATPDIYEPKLLGRSESWAARRFATDGRIAFCGVEHAPGRWHGFPVGWKEVPAALRQKWLNEGKVKRSDVHTYWDKTP